MLASTNASEGKARQFGHESQASNAKLGVIPTNKPEPWQVPIRNGICIASDKKHCQKMGAIGI